MRPPDTRNTQPTGPVPPQVPPPVRGEPLNLKRWWATASAKARAGLVAAFASVFVVCSCLGVAAAVGGGGGSSTTPPGTAQQQATNTPAGPTATTKPAATATHAPPTAVPPTATTQGASGGAPVLGGPGQAFIALYGPLTSQSNTSRGDLHFRQYPGVAQDYLDVELGAYFGLTTGGQNAANIAVQAPPGQPWTATQAHDECALFLPADAQRVNAVDVPDSQGGLLGQDVIYQSATLAQTFPASAFVDANHSAVTPGTFDVFSLYHGNTPDYVNTCQFNLGSQQTVG